MTAQELVKASRNKIIFIVYKKMVDRKYPNKEIPYQIKLKNSTGMGNLYLYDSNDFQNHYDIGYCISKQNDSSWYKTTADKVAWWIDKSKIFKPERFEIDFESKILLVHLKFR